jgi:hypothetical protein
MAAKSLLVLGLQDRLPRIPGKNFRIPPREELRLRFAIASDGHYGQAGTEFDVLHDRMLGWLTDEKSTRGLDFTMINGDLFHDDAALLPIITEKWDRLHMPYFVSHGNHDKVDEDRWKSTWNMGWHHDFELSGISFLILNTADKEGKYICPDLDWTRQQLQQKAAANALFVFMHITPFAWTKAGMACPDLTGLFAQQANLKVIFHGHDHDQDGLKTDGLKPYLFDSHIAGNWGTPYRGYRIIEMTRGGEIISYQMNPDNQQTVNRQAWQPA